MFVGKLYAFRFFEQKIKKIVDKAVDSVDNFVHNFCKAKILYTAADSYPQKIVYNLCFLWIAMTSFTAKNTKAVHNFFDGGMKRWIAKHIHIYDAAATQFSKSSYLFDCMFAC